MRPAGASIVGGAVFVAASMIGGAALAALRGRGFGDLRAFFFWTLPGAGLVLLVAGLLSSATRGLTSLVAVVVHAVAGTALGFAWTLAAAASLGPWMRAFSFPVAPIWTIAGALGLIGAVISCRPRSWPLAVLAACIPVVTVVVITRSVPPPPLQAIVTLVEGATHGDAAVVVNTVISRPEPGKKGVRPLLGISTLGPWDVGGRKRFKLGFHRSTTAERRTEILREIAASPLVAGVEDVVPNR
jgi:hypothetical protein